MLVLGLNTSKAKAERSELKVSLGYIAKSYERKRGGEENRSRKRKETQADMQASRVWRGGRRNWKDLVTFPLPLLLQKSTKSCLSTQKNSQFLI